MPLIFPINPVNNQIYPDPIVTGYPQFQWNATTNTWAVLSTISGGGSSNNSNQVIFSATPPSQRSNATPLVAGDFWFDTTTTYFFIYLTDSDSNQWIQLNRTGNSSSNNLSNTNYSNNGFKLNTYNYNEGTNINKVSFNNNYIYICSASRGKFESTNPILGLDSEDTFYISLVKLNLSGDRIYSKQVEVLANTTPSPNLNFVGEVYITFLDSNYILIGCAFYLLKFNIETGELIESQRYSSYIEPSAINNLLFIRGATEQDKLLVLLDNDTLLAEGNGLKLNFRPTPTTELNRLVITTNNSIFLFGESNGQPSITRLNPNTFSFVETIYVNNVGNLNPLGNISSNNNQLFLFSSSRALILNDNLNSGFYYQVSGGTVISYDKNVLIINSQEQLSTFRATYIYVYNSNGQLEYLLKTKQICNIKILERNNENNLLLELPDIDTGTNSLVLTKDLTKSFSFTYEVSTLIIYPVSLNFDNGITITRTNFSKVTGSEELPRELLSPLTSSLVSVNSARGSAAYNITPIY